MTDISIGELSRRSGVKAGTIRYYEEAGLIAAPPRSDGGQRRYDAKAVRQLNFVRHARELGFALPDIRELLAMAEAPQASCDAADSIARRHLEEVERRIESLVALRGELSRMVAECGHGKVCDCRVIEVLADHGLCGSEHGGR
ncbi:MAG: MerR family transcriptional regulator [Pseudochelatococcus sp.]|jgi:DNA-binding transcriptional MerR regulator|uniref:MerR family transcriptional regulator n=1 Tax=Pseudochelatococcus sp. TaxID=2020869 RepID=UPI003D929FC5